MKLALECPTRLLEMIQPFSDFSFVLAKKFLEDEAYADFYKHIGGHTIVDCSTNEEGEPVDVEDLITVSNLVNAHFIVAPDWFGDAEKTVHEYKQFIEKVSPEKVIGVLQGQTFADAIGCIESYLGVIAVPYAICSNKATDSPKLMELRRALIVSNIPKDRWVHLFGFTTLSEFFWYQERPNVASIDTGIPVLLGLQGLDILDDLELKDIPTDKQMDKYELEAKGWTAICRNIALMRKYMP